MKHPKKKKMTAHFSVRMGGAEEGSGRRGVKQTLDNAPHAAVHADPKPKSKQEQKAERDHHRHHEMKIGQWMGINSESDI